MLKEFRRQAPDWLEKFPELPALGLGTLQDIKTIAAAVPAIQATQESMRDQGKSRFYKGVLKSLSLLFFSLALLCLYRQPDLENPVFLTTFAIALVALVLI